MAVPGGRRTLSAVGIMLVLVDRFDEVVVGTTERVVKARTVHHKVAGQRGDARYARSIRGVPWQPGPAKVAEGEPSGMARIVSVPMARIEHLPAVPVVEPRECRALRFSIRPEVLRAATRRSWALRRSRAAH